MVGISGMLLSGRDDDDAFVGGDVNLAVWKFRFSISVVLNE